MIDRLDFDDCSTRCCHSVFQMICDRERTIIGSVSYRNRYWVYRIESYRLLLYRPILRASLQVHQQLADRITHDDQRAFKRPVTRPTRTHTCVLFYVELCAAADQMSASRRHRFRDVFTSCCTPAICC